MKDFIFIILLSSIFYSCEKEISTTQPEDPPPTGKIVILSNPSGSLIYSNNKNTGRRTPDSLSWIEPGDYTITLKRKLYKDTSFVMTAMEEKKVEKYIDYFANPAMYGKIEFISNPGKADIFVNDSSLGMQTPATVSGWLPGSYKVNYRLEGFRESQLNISVESSKITKASTSLKDTSVWVDYQTNNSGIQSNRMTCITVDKNDIIWMGTDDKGIISYDRKEFVHINTTNSQLPSNNIRSIDVDKFNSKWICTDNGLAVLDDAGSIIVYNKDNSLLSSNNINTVYFVEDNFILIGTANGLFGIIDGTWRRYGVGGLTLDGIDLTLVWINDIEVVADTFYLATNHLGIISLWGNKFFTRFGPEKYKSIHTNRALVVEKDASGNLWFGMNSDSLVGGVTVFDGENWIGNNFGNYNDALFEDLFIDSENNKWFATKNALFKFGGLNDKSRLTNLNWGLTINHTTGVAQTRDKIFWITTFGGGLIKYKGN